MPQKSAAEIIKKDYTRQTENPRQAALFMVGIADLAKRGLCQIVQIGGTVFLINKFNQNQYQYPVGEGEVHIFVDEPVKNLPNRLAAFANTLRQMGYRKVHTFSVVPVMVRLLERVKAKTGAQMTVRQGQTFMYGRMMPVYMIEIQVA